MAPGGDRGDRTADAARLAALEHAPNVRSVLLSGDTAETLDLELVVRRGVRFVSKPLSSCQLLAEQALAGEAPGG